MSVGSSPSSILKLRQEISVAQLSENVGYLMMFLGTVLINLRSNMGDASAFEYFKGMERGKHIS